MCVCVCGCDWVGVYVGVISWVGKEVCRLGKGECVCVCVCVCVRECVGEEGSGQP